MVIDREYVQVTSEHPAHQWELIVAAVGSLMNLWIGISFITIIEVLEICYHIISMCCCPRKKKVEGEGEKERDVERGEKSSCGR